MALSYDLASLFAKATKDKTPKSTESIVYGTVVEQGVVQLDGSDVLTPVSSTVKMEAGERVIVSLKNHTATVTGNLTTHAARSDDLSDAIDQISVFEIVIADKASIDDLTAVVANIGELTADNVVIKERLTASEAIIGDLEADNVVINGKLTATEAEINKLSVGKLDADFAEITYATITELNATNATIYNLSATYGDFVELTTDKFTAIEAIIGDLDVDHLTAEEADLRYANIDFANIGEAAIQNFYAKSGMIEDLVVSDGSFTGTLVGVEIIADYITSGTLKAERLVLKGDDGLFHEINVAAGGITEGEVVPDDAILGSVIVAKSITAEQIRVDDLIAFDAKIGGFNIGSNSLYSGVKESIDNSTRGVYMDTDGQVYFGDADNYIRYYKETNADGSVVLDSEGNAVYKLAISAESIIFGENSKSSAEDLQKLTEHVKIGTYLDPDTGNEKPSVELAEGDSDYKQVITNTDTMFMDGDDVKTRINTDGVYTNNLNVSGEFRQGKWVWAERANGNYGLTWKEATE